MAVIEEVQARRNELGCSRSGAFYRGHSHAAHRLVPSLLRIAVEPDTELNIFHECFARAHHMLSGKASSWEALALLQHYGVPTRLLDWTESFAIALFFAISAPDPEPHLWITNAFRLNKAAGAQGSPRIFVIGLDEVPEYLQCFAHQDRQCMWPYRKPLFVQVPWTSDRVRAQAGFFTIHSDPAPLEEVCPKHVRKVAVPPEALEGARKYLELTGISEHTIFPDFVGLAQFLKRSYGL